MGKVIEFPNRNNNVPQNIDEIKRNLKESQDASIEAAVDNVAVAVAQTLFKMGFSTINPYDMGLLLDMIKSMICRSYHVEHPLQQMAIDTVVLTNANGQYVTADGTIITEGLDPSEDS